MSKEKMTPEQIWKLCREHCERIEGFYNLPREQQLKIFWALVEIAQE